MISIPVVILAGGIGERIKVLTSGKPKTLLQLIGKHIVEYTLENLIAMGIRRMYIIVNNPRDFEDIAIKYGRYLELDIIQQKMLGIEGAIISAKDVIDDDFVLLYGDIIAPADMYKELLSIYTDHRYGVTLVPEEEVESYIVAKLGSTTYIESFVEGSSIIDRSSFYAVGGAYILPREFIDIVESYGNIIRALNETNIKHKLRPCIWSGWWVDIEYPWDLLRASLYLLHKVEKSIISNSSKISSRAIIEGPVIIDDDVEIDHFAIVKGPVYIGRKSYIGSHSFIRSFVSLEGENVVGSYVELVWSSIQRGATIGSRSYIGFSIIGENSIIEPGVITLNIVPEETKIARAIKMEKRGREYTKLGAIIGLGTRVKAYTVLKPGEIV